MTPSQRIRRFRTQVDQASMGLSWTNDEEHDSLDAELGRRLSQLSDTAKFAASLNQIQRVAIRRLYDSPEQDGATVYVLDVYLQTTQKGLPTSKTNESAKARRRRLQREQDNERPDYAVEHRYSDFRALRKSIYDVADVHDDQMHPVWCNYCCRVLWLMTYGSFPSRYPNKGVLATCTGWRSLLAKSRKRRLENFVNELLTSAKDASYCRGGQQCERFVAVSRMLQTFLTDENVTSSQTSGSSSGC